MLVTFQMSTVFFLKVHFFPVDSKNSDEESESVQIPPLIYDFSNYLS